MLRIWGPQYIDGLVQDYNNFSVLVMELVLYCSEPSMWIFKGADQILCGLSTKTQNRFCNFMQYIGPSSKMLHGTVGFSVAQLCTKFRVPVNFDFPNLHMHTKTEVKYYTPIRKEWSCSLYGIPRYLCVIWNSALLIPWNSMEPGEIWFGDARVPWNSM